MEGGGSAGGGLYAAHQERPRQGEVEEKAGRRRQPRATEGGMKFRVSARAPHGVGALLLVGGAVVAGAAAVIAWRHARHGCRRRPAKREDVADGGVAKAGKKGVASVLEVEADQRPGDKVQGDASPPGETHRPDDDNLRGEEEKETDTESKNGLVGHNGRRVTEEEIQEVHEDADDEGAVCSSLPAVEFQSSERVVVEKHDLDLGKSSTEISILHDDVDMMEHVEIYDDIKDPSSELPETTTLDMDAVPAEKVDDDSVTKEGTDGNDRDSAENDEENSSKSEAEKQDNDDEVVEASDDQHSQQSMMSTPTSRPGIVVLDEQSLGGGAQEAESMENSPTADLITHPEQLSDDDVTNVDAEGESTPEASGPEEGAVVTDDEAPAEQGQQKEAVTMAELVGLVADAVPALSLSSSPVKVKPVAEKKETAESMENSPTADLITHPGQLSGDDVMGDAEGKTAEAAEPEERAVSDEESPAEQGQQKVVTVGEQVGVVADGLPALSLSSSPVNKVKPAAAEKKEAESVENSPTADLIMHPEQLSDDDDVTGDAGGEAAADQPEPEEGVISDKEEEAEPEAAEVEPVGVADDAPPALSSSSPAKVKPAAAEKREPSAELPAAGRVVESGMKMEQDYTTNAGGVVVKDRALIGRGGAGGAMAGVVTVDRRNFSMAILALMFALTVGVAIALARLYAPPRAAKLLQMDLP